MSQNAERQPAARPDDRAYLEADEAEVVALWTACGLVRPWNDPRKDIARKRAVQRDLFLVGVVARPCPTAIAGYDGHRGWVNYLAVDPAQPAEGRWPAR